MGIIAAGKVNNYEQPLIDSRNHSSCPDMISGPVRKRSYFMATFKDPTQCFAPIEVVERLLEIRAELGFAETLYMIRSEELTDFLDAYGFDIYAFSTGNEKINYGDYRSPVVPGGDTLHTSAKAH